MLTSAEGSKKGQYNASNRIVSLLAYQFQSSFRQCKSKFNQTAVQYPEKHQSVLFLARSCVQEPTGIKLLWLSVEDYKSTT